MTSKITSPGGIHIEYYNINDTTSSLCIILEPFFLAHYEAKTGESGFYALDLRMDFVDGLMAAFDK